ncbi:hypothetical protein ABZP36_002874 [Zizania latifolia]
METGSNYNVDTTDPAPPTSSAKTSFLKTFFNGLNALSARTAASVWLNLQLAYSAAPPSPYSAPCLAVLGHCHHAAIARLLDVAASPDGSVFLAHELLPDASPLCSLLRNPSTTASPPPYSSAATARASASSMNPNR